jgi:hypothetical protein
MPVKCICKYCGKEFETYMAEIKKGGGKFCCSKHYHLWIKENHIRSGDKCNLWKDATVEITCKYCGKKKRVYKSQIKWRGASFCNKACRAKWVKENKSGVDSWNWKGKVKCTCQICGTIFEVTHADIKRGRGKHCSYKCRGLNHTKNKNSNWNNGSSFAPYCFKFNKKRKDAVRKFFGNACICCSKHVTENIVKTYGQIELSVHHIDHDKEQGCNGKPFNLVPMCNECHAKELNKQEEYHDYINKTISEGFKWGIWSKEEYTNKVMYPE